MPPKQKTGKKEEELESLEGLPKAFPFLVQLQYKVNTSATKDVLKEQLEGQLPDNSKLITRDDIMECGKRKDLFAEEDDPANPPAEKMAKSAAAKMYELLVAAMKDKGAKYKEIKNKAIADYLAAQKPKEEEAKGKGGKVQPPAKPPGKKEELPQIDVPVTYPDDEIDIFVFLKDFPQNEAEASFFSKEKYASNLIVRIKEGPPLPIPPASEEKSEEEKKEPPPPPSEPTEEEKQKLAEDAVAYEKEKKAAEELLLMLSNLARKSERDSPLRHTIDVDIEYNADQVDQKAGIAGFQGKLMEMLKNIGLLYINYFKFLENVKRQPLCKLPPTAPELEVKKEPEKKIEEKKEEGTKEEPPQEEKKVKLYDTEAVYPYKSKPHPQSFDEFPKVWQLLKYTHSISGLNKEAQSIGAILACLLYQIESGNEEKPQQKLNAQQELVQEFDFARSLVAGLMEPKNPKEVVKEEIAEIPKGYPEVIYDSQEIVKTLYHSEKPLEGNQSVCETELSVLENLVYPGKNRNMMPLIPSKPKVVRDALNCENSSFSTLPIYEFDRASLISEFEKMFAKSIPQSSWNFGDRIYEEMYSSSKLAEVFSNYMLFSPDIFTSYYVLKDALLVGLLYMTPPGRILYKQWKSNFVHLPDFPNFRNVFSSGNQPPPSSLLDVDDNKVGLVEERQKLLYPSDKSIIQIVYKKVAGIFEPSVNVIKENYIFGLHEINKGNSKFWLQFENGTRLSVEMQKKKDSEIKEAIATITLSCGLIAKFTADADIIQVKSENICKEKTQSEPEEQHRVISGKGTVSKYMDNGSIDILMANGSTSEYKNGCWIGTNSLGKRRCRKSEERELDPIKSATNTDPVSQARVTLRQDGVMTIKYKDGRLLAKHKDETTMLTSPDGCNITVEKAGFAPVRIKIDPEKAKIKNCIKKQDILLGAGDGNLLTRAYDGKTAVTYLPDGTEVESFLERVEGEQNAKGIHIIKRPDGSIIKLTGDGEIIIVTPQERVELNNKGQKKEFGKDVDYFAELNSEEKERKPGIYTAKCNFGTLFTKDDEGNTFLVNADGTTKEKIIGSIEETKDFPQFQGNTFIDEKAKSLQAPKFVNDPKLFIIRNDGTGSELICEKQLANYFRCRENEIKNISNPLKPQSFRFESGKIEGMSNSKAISFITTFIRERDYLKNLSFISGIETPQIIKALVNAKEKPKETLNHLASFRCLIKHPEFYSDKQEIYKKNLEDHKIWKEKQDQTAKGFGIGENRTPEEIKKEKGILTTILKERKEKEIRPNQSSIKLDVIKEHDANRKREKEEAQKKKLEGEQEKKRKEEAAAIELQRRTQFPAMPKKVKKPKKEEIPVTRTDAVLADVAKSRESDGMTATISQISNAGEFVPNYFYTKKGIEVKHEPVSEHKLKEWNSKKRQSILKGSKGQSKPDSEDKKVETEGNIEQVQEVDKHNPIVALEPEDTEMKNKLTEQGKSMQSMLGKKSHYQETMERMKEIEQKERENAENYHISKTKDFTVFGVTRMHKPVVGVLNRPKPVAEINEQYISIDAITDRRIKTLSMSNRGYFRAPPVQTIRKQGQHQMIAKALNKKQTFEELMAETNSMINYSLHDPNKRNFIVLPPSARFGKLKVGGIYETELQCKNEDVMPQRFTVRQPKSMFIRVINDIPGPVAQGMKAILRVQIYTSDKANEKIQDEFQLITKTEIYKIAVFAHVLSAEEFDSLQSEAFKLNNRPLLLPTVREKGKEEKKIGTMEASIGRLGASGENETSMSGVRLPKIGHEDTSQIELDPNKKIDDILKKEGAHKET